MNPKEDRLSDLPNDIITKILSHLITKEVVRSDVLSKRWKSVWLSVPTLVVNQQHFMLNGETSDDNDAEARLSNFMFKILIARKLPSFEKIYILCYNLDNHLVILWMQAALKRDVSELEVVFYDCRIDDDGDTTAIPCELTHNLFSYNKLVVFKLTGYLAPHFPKTSSCFPNLKELELKDIDYRDEDSLPNLLSSCPVLEYLEIIRDDWEELYDYSVTLVIKSRSLKRLTVINCIDTIRTEEKVFKTVFDAPAVEQLNISYNITKEYVVKDLSSLVKAHLIVLNWSKVLNFLKSLPQLEILTLTFGGPEEVSNISELDVPSCLITRLKTIEAYYTSCNDIEKLRYLLRNAKMLERMTIRFYPQSRSELYNARFESANIDTVICYRLIDQYH